MNHTQKRQVLEAKVTELVSRGLPLEINFANTGWRLTTLNQRENVSLRLSYSEMLVYLDGFRDAMQFAGITVCPEKEG